ncbi:MAG: PP2C family protein-serine/threonine phosphatase [Cyclobacteriaceae bacterium]
MNTLDLKDLQLNALLEVTQAINSNLPEEDLLRIYKFTLLADLKIQRLALFTEQKGSWVCRVHFGTVKSCEDVILDPKYISLKKEEKIEPNSEFEEQFELVFPVYHKDKLLAIVFTSTGDDLAFENRFLNALTNIMLVAIENKKLARKQLEQETYQKELEIAKKVQNFLFPKQLPRIERLQVEAFYLPHQDVGGDYYDYIPITEDKFLICIADVSGKGVPAALLMSNFQASLRTLVRHSFDLEEIVNELNLTTYISGNAENFITFFAAIYDFNTKELEYINCGHNEIVLSVNDKIQLLNEGTTILGMFSPLPFIKTETIENLTDFFLFAYTDGLTETFNEEDEAFEFENLKALIENQLGSLHGLHNKILDELIDFKGNRNFHDDITMLSCRVQNG